MLEDVLPLLQAPQAPPANAPAPPATSNGAHAHAPAPAGGERPEAGAGEGAGPGAELGLGLGLDSQEPRAERLAALHALLGAGGEPRLRHLAFAALMRLGGAPATLFRDAEDDEPAGGGAGAPVAGPAGHQTLALCMSRRARRSGRACVTRAVPWQARSTCGASQIRHPATSAGHPCMASCPEPNTARARGSGHGQRGDRRAPAGARGVGARAVDGQRRHAPRAGHQPAAAARRRPRREQPRRRRAQRLAAPRHVRRCAHAQSYCSLLKAACVHREPASAHHGLRSTVALMMRREVGAWWGRQDAQIPRDDLHIPMLGFLLPHV